MTRKPLKPVVEISRDAVLDVEQVADGLGVSVATVERSDLPCFFLGASQSRCRRFIWGQVLDHLARRAVA